MESIRTIIKPVIDLEGTGAKIKNLRKSCGYTVHELQRVFGFEYPQAIYAWEQGKNAPTIDNMLILSSLFNVSLGDLVVTRNVEIDVDYSERRAS